MSCHVSEAENIYNTFLKRPNAPRLVHISDQNVLAVRERLKSVDPNMFDEVRC